MEEPGKETNLRYRFSGYQPQLHICAILTAVGWISLGTARTLGRHSLPPPPKPKTSNTAMASDNFMELKLDKSQSLLVYMT